MGSIGQSISRCSVAWDHNMGGLSASLVGCFTFTICMDYWVLGVAELSCTAGIRQSYPFSQYSRDHTALVRRD